MTCGTASLSAPCFAGIARAATRPPGCCTCPPSSATLILHRLPSISPSPAIYCSSPANGLAVSRCRCRQEGRHDGTRTHRLCVLRTALERGERSEPGIRSFLAFIAAERGRPITRLTIEDLTAERVRLFLGHLETHRGNHIRSRNQRLAGLHTFFSFLARQVPEALAEAERVAAIPRKRAPPPPTQF